MSTLQQLKQVENSMVAAIRATTAEINQIGKLPLQVALAELQEATAEAKHRMAEAMAILRAAIGDVIETTEEMAADLNADIAAIVGIPEVTTTSSPDEPNPVERQEEKLFEPEYDSPHTNRIHPATMSTANHPAEVVSRFGEDGLGISTPDVTIATIPEPSRNGTSHGKKKRK